MRGGSHSVEALIESSGALADAVDKLRFAAPVVHVYNPLRYAAAMHEEYLTRYGFGPKEVVLVGMNPGPFGMAQTGVPFGDVGMVRDFLGLGGAKGGGTGAKIGVPPKQHAKRPVLGLGCPRGEVSGQRLWGWARDRFGTADVFFARFFVVNYCPLAFLEESGRNLTPDKLPAVAQAKLFTACDEALRQTVDTLRPRFVIGVGAFAAGRAAKALATRGGRSHPDLRIGHILHPSPASPFANRGWAAAVERQLADLGVALPRGAGGRSMDNPSDRSQGG